MERKEREMKMQREREREGKRIPIATEDLYSGVE